MRDRQRALQIEKQLNQKTTWKPSRSISQCFLNALRETYVLLRM